MRHTKSRYEELVEKAAEPDHPSQRGYLPVIVLAPKPTSSYLSIGYFSHWAKQDGSDIIRPIDRLFVSGEGLRYGGFNQHQPNAGAICIDPEQMDRLPRYNEFPLPAPIIVTKEGEPDLAPLLTAHLGYHMWAASAFTQPDFAASPIEGSSDYNHWAVGHVVYHGIEPAPRITVLAAIWGGYCTPEKHMVYAAEYNRLTTQAAVDRAKALLGRSANTLDHEVYYQS